MSLPNLTYKEDVPWSRDKCLQLSVNVQKLKFEVAVPKGVVPTAWVVGKPFIQGIKSSHDQERLGTWRIPVVVNSRLILEKKGAVFTLVRKQNYIIS